MTIIYKASLDGEWEQYRCLLSGRKEFDSYESVYKSRALVLSGAAVEARAMQGAIPHAIWVYCETTRSARQLLGPDL